jgi:Tol biopolymer transport system component
MSRANRFKSYLTPLVVLLLVIMPAGCGGGSSSGGSSDPSPISMVTETDAGISGNEYSEDADISGNGRYVVFESETSNLISPDTNIRDILMRDMDTGVFSRISQTSTGAEPDGRSSNPDISDSGQVIVYESLASDLASGDDNSVSDVFSYDTATGITSLLSVSPAGTVGDAGSSNVATCVSGNYVVFQSDAANLTPGDSGSFRDIFLRDTVMDETTRVSVFSSPAFTEGNGDSQHPAVSSGGRFVVFQSDAANLVADDGNEMTDIFVHDTLLRETTRVSVSSSLSSPDGNGNSESPDISSDGVYIVFSSQASNLDSTKDDAGINTDIFLHNQNTGVTRRITNSTIGNETDGSSIEPSISTDGSYIVFQSSATNLVTGDSNNETDIFVYDTALDSISIVSVSESGTQATLESTKPAISADGEYVVFQSETEDLVAGTIDFSGEANIYRAPRP